MDKTRLIETSSARETGVINLTVLEALKQFQQIGEPDFVTELIDLFLDDTEVQLESLRVAVSKNDMPEVLRLAHLVKGSSGNIGATGLAELCHEIEKLDRDAGLYDSYVQNLLLKLQDEFRQVSEAFKAHRQET
jgi:HPt (histidine-containing phosphotransfer) domain-containing protein